MCYNQHRVERKTHADVAQSVERILGKDEVTGSNPVISSIGLAGMQVLFFIYACCEGSPGGGLFGIFLSAVLGMKIWSQAVPDMTLPGKCHIRHASAPDQLFKARAVVKIAVFICPDGLGIVDFQQPQAFILRKNEQCGGERVGCARIGAHHSHRAP